MFQLFFFYSVTDLQTVTALLKKYRYTKKLLSYSNASKCNKLLSTSALDKKVKESMQLPCSSRIKGTV